MGECKIRTVVPSTPVAVDTFVGRIQVERDHDAAFNGNAEMVKLPVKAGACSFGSIKW